MEGDRGVREVLHGVDVGGLEEARGLEVSERPLREREQELAVSRGRTSSRIRGIGVRGAPCGFTSVVTVALLEDAEVLEAGAPRVVSRLEVGRHEAGGALEALARLL